MSATIRIDFDDLDRVFDVLELHPRYDELIREIRDLIAEETKENFESESDPQGGKWPDLAPATIRKRTAKGTWPGKKLHDSGALEEAATVPDAPGNIDNMNRNSLEYGVYLPYGEFHQTGTRRMPKRQFLGLSDRLKRKIEEVIQEFVEREMALWLL